MSPMSPGLGRSLVQVVVERAVVEELGRAVAAVESRGHRSDVGGKSVEAM
jgi:hypothetical protein